MQKKCMHRALRRWVMTVVFLCMAAALAACGTNGQSGAGSGADSGAGAGPDAGASSKGVNKLAVTSTIAMIHDLVVQIGGEHVEAVALMGPGTDPHMYAASQGDIRRLDGADVIFYNGLYLEGRMEDILERLADTKTVVAVAEQLPEELLLAAEEEGGVYDPHVWFDVSLWMQVAETIRDTLMAADPTHAASYEERAAAYLSELQALDDYVYEQLQSIPAERRVLVTAHDAFGYFGRAYELEVLGLQGISTAAEIGSRDVSALRDLLVERGIKAVFVETSVSERSITAVIEGARRLGHEIVIGGHLYSDAMGEAGTAEGTYVGMVRHNVHTIVEALR